jgi:orotidine-5'-phosphate decarboxylase
MGFDSVEPYLEWKDRGAIILCRTSNPGGSDLQFLQVDGVPLYQHVARLVAEKWNRHSQCGLVVGATFPRELAEVRKLVGDMPLLVPGVGAQGGDVATVCEHALTDDGGILINVSRGIIYASSQEDFASKAQEAAKMYQQEMQQFIK